MSTVNGVVDRVVIIAMESMSENVAVVEEQAILSAGDATGLGKSSALRVTAKANLNAGFARARAL